MSFLRFLGVPMADELPDNAGAAMRGLLGAAAFIAILIGAEQLVEHYEQRFYLGVGLIACGAGIFFIGVFWKWLRKKIGPRISINLEWFASDPRWWALILLMFLVLFHSTTAPTDWVWIGAALGGLAIFLFNWRYFKPQAAAEGPSQVAQNTQPDGQTHLDLAHLLDFGVNETTFWMLDRLLETADSPAVTDGLKSGPHTAEAHNSRQWFIGHARQELGAGTFRHSEYLSVMHNAEIDAELDLEGTPLDQRPAGIDPLTLRRYRISELQFNRAILFIRNQKREAKDRLVNARHSLIERVEQRNRGARG